MFKNDPCFSLVYCTATSHFESACARAPDGVTLIGCSAQTSGDPEIFLLTGLQETFIGPITPGCTGLVITQPTGLNYDIP